MTSIACRSLAAEEPSTLHETADVCVVGAGAAGTYLASRLVSAGLRVLLIETGPEIPIDADQAGLVPVFEKDVYSGATNGRAAGLGGTTARWGGQLLPNPPQDAQRPDPALQRAWTSIVDTVHQHGATVARTLGVDPGQFAAGGGPALPSLAQRALRQVGLEAHWSVWLPFRKRNLAWMLDRRCDSGALKVYVDATVSAWGLRQQGGRAWVGTVEARGIGGQRLVAESGCIVVCAGAIESTRIILELDEGAKALPRLAAVGQGLSDHLSATVAHIHPDDGRRATKTFAPRFRQGCMRTPRFVDASPDPGASRWFAHLLFDREDVAFSVARAVLLGLQARRLPAVPLRDLARASVGVAQLGWTRVVKQRLFIPAWTPVRLQLDLEQRPQSSNRISLAEELDSFGRRRCRVAWGVSATDEDDLRSVVGSLSLRWRRLESHMPRMQWIDPAASLQKAHGAYHPVGTCRLGDDDEAVLDPDLRLRGYGNLFVLSTGAFPTAGSANPTFGLLCLAERLASRLARGMAHL